MLMYNALVMHNCSTCLLNDRGYDPARENERVAGFEGGMFRMFLLARLDSHVG